MSDPHMIPDRDLLYADHQVQMAYAHIIGYLAFSGIQYAQPDTHALADPVPKEQTITGSLEKRRE
jgi:hypothetical protein